MATLLKPALAGILGAKLGGGGDGAGELSDLEVGISLTAEATKDFSLVMPAECGSVLRARLYIDADPGAAFAELATLSLYSESTRLAEDLILRVTDMLVYTELSIATTGSDADFTVDDNSDLSIDDSVAFVPATPEFHIVNSIGAPNTAEDDIAAHAIDVGVVRVVVLDMNTFLADGANILYGRLEFPGAETVSMNFQMRVVA